ncbi:hypothetical protein Syun_016652 [Stephania yunnanensis]|uniref:Uncharacterized protein n=1 Tax=Stephania yunnanensis TaxID=152371 RepID=A0AAP0P460_9MAGN
MVLPSSLDSSYDASRDLHVLPFSFLAVLVLCWRSFKTRPFSWRVQLMMP